MNAWWTVGAGLAVVVDGCAVLLPGGDVDLAEQLWAELSAQPAQPLAYVLAALTARYDLRQMPGFAVATFEASTAATQQPRTWSVRSAVRGDHWIELDGQRVQAAGVFSWVERSDAGVARITLGAAQIEAESDPAAAVFPLIAGVVPAGRVHVGTDRREDPAPVAQGAEASTDQVLTTPAAAVTIPETDTIWDEPDEDPQAAAPLQIAASPEPVQSRPEPAPSSPSVSLTSDESHPAPPAGSVSTGSPAVSPYLAAWQHTVVRPVSDAAFTADEAEDGPGAPTTDPVRHGGAGSSPARQQDRALADGQPALDEGSPDTRQVADGAEIRGDHDGHTVASVAEVIAGLSTGHAGIIDSMPVGGYVPTPRPATAPSSNRMVIGIACDSGHVNPPTAEFCGTCGHLLGAAQTLLPHPPLGRLRVSTGQVFDLVGTILIGRSPASAPVHGDDLPVLVVVPSPNQEISRTQVEIRVEDWTVLARDRGSRNGTLLNRDGERPVKLPEVTPVPVLAGDVLDLGDGVHVVIEGRL